MIERDAFDALYHDAKERAAWWGVMVGIVTNIGDPKHQGRVKLKLPTVSDSAETAWAPVLTPNAGPGSGLQLLPDVDDAVLVAFEGGDINRPYVLGSFWGGKAGPPETGDDAGKQQVLRSRSGHVIRLDDREGQERVEIVDTSGNNKITIETANNSITIHTNGPMALTTDGDLELSAGQALKLSGQRVTVESKVDLALIRRGTYRSAIQRRADPARRDGRHQLAASRTTEDTMGQPAAKQGDVVVALDTHVVVLSVSGMPTPLPLRSTVRWRRASARRSVSSACRRPRSAACSNNLPPHIPQGGTFPQPPSNRGTIQVGSRDRAHQREAGGPTWGPGDHLQRPHRPPGRAASSPSDRCGSDERDFLGSGWASPIALDGDGRIGRADHEAVGAPVDLDDPGHRARRARHAPDLRVRHRRLVFAPNNSLTQGLVSSSVRQALVEFEPRIDVLDVVRHRRPAPTRPACSSRSTTRSAPPTAASTSSIPSRSSDHSLTRLSLPVPLIDSRGHQAFVDQTTALAEHFSEWRARRRDPTSA